MKESTGLLLKLSEQRERINGFADDGDAGDLDKLKAESIDLEGKYRAAVHTEETGSHRTTQGSVGREYEQLVRKASVGKIVHAVASGRQADGAEAELLKHHDLAGNQIPLAMLAAEPQKFATATVVGDEPAVAGEVLGIVFPQSVAQWCGVVGSTVPTGQRQVPVLSTGATASALAKGAALTESTAAFVVKTLTPKRLSAAVRYSREDSSTFSYLDESLRMNLRNSISDKMDAEVLTRAGGGLLAHGTDPTQNGSSISNTSHALSGIFGGVDGKYASMASEIKLLLGTSTYSELGQAIFDTGSGALASEKLGQVCGGLRVSANVPAKASTGEDALIVKGQGRRNCVSAMWDSIEIVMDPFSSADKAEIVLTAIAMFDFAILDTAGFTRVRFK